MERMTHSQQFQMTLRLVGTADTLERLMRFLAFFHFNSGHSGTFAMTFDGDGHERLTIDPPPSETLRGGVNAIARACDGVEVAVDGGYIAVKMHTLRSRYRADDAGRLVEERSGPDGYEIVRVCREPSADL